MKKKAIENLSPLFEKLFLEKNVTILRGKKQRVH